MTAPHSSPAPSAPAPPAAGTAAAPAAPEQLDVPVAAEMAETAETGAPAESRSVWRQPIDPRIRPASALALGLYRRFAASRRRLGLGLILAAGALALAAPLVALAWRLTGHLSPATRAGASFALFLGIGAALATAAAFTGRVRAYGRIHAMLIAATAVSLTGLLGEGREVLYHLTAPAMVGFGSGSAASVAVLAFLRPVRWHQRDGTLASAAKSPSSR